ncbi:unnamed protein product [Auanema sp. JU1783]|nr:unnamed protein product [Auanema sp. JU1783]
MGETSIKKSNFLKLKRKYGEEEKTDEDVKRTKVDLEDDTKLWKNIAVASKEQQEKPEDYLLKLILQLENGLSKNIHHEILLFSKSYKPKGSESAKQIVFLLFSAVKIVNRNETKSLLLSIILRYLPKLDDISKRNYLLSLIESGNGMNLLDDSLDPFILNIITYGLKERVLEPEDLNDIVLRCAKRNLRNYTSSSARIAAIQFYVESFSISNKVCNCQFLEETLCQLMDDRDSRVRLTAVKGVSMILEKKDTQLGLKTYKAMTKMMSDSDRHSRVTALRIILSFANATPEVKVPMNFNKNEQVFLTDDAFSIVCHAINDTEVMVRTEAAKLLGQFSAVSDDFLDQTLDKKLMRAVQTATGTVVRKEAVSLFTITKQAPPPKRGADGSRWKSFQQSRERKTQYADEWASGKDLNAPCPTGEVKTIEEDSIIPQGACGAFVSALEDEFMSVRKAAVYSLGKLAAHRPSFATSALDHLADMFNDEIASVRLDAIHALTPLVIHGQLLKEQLEVILKCLDDAMWESRQALRDLLCKAEFADLDCMKLVVKALLQCLHRFPADREKIYKCMSQIGSNHGVFVHCMVNGLLDVHPIFDAQEHPIDDVFYTAKLILVLNAAAKHEPVASLFPYYVLRHYRFMRAARPSLVPAVTRIDEKLLLSSKAITTKSDNKGNNVEVLLKTYERLRDVQLESLSHDKNVLRHYIAEDLAAISSFNAPLSGAANFLVSLCEVLSSLESIQQSVVSGGNLLDVVSLLDEEKVRVKCLAYQFSNLNSSLLSMLIEIGLHLDILMIMIRLTKNSEDYANIIDDLLEIISVCEKRWSELTSPPTAGAQSLIRTIQDKVTNIDEKADVSSAYFGKLLHSYAIEIPESLPDIYMIQCKWAKITEPEKEFAAESAMRFTSGLPIALSLAADLHNLTEEDVSTLRIQVDYPDQSRSFHRPRQTDFTSISNKRLLTTKVILTTNTFWAESALASLTIVLTADSDGNTPVPLCQSPSSQEPCQIQVRLHPMYRTTESQISVGQTPKDAPNINSLSRCYILKRLTMNPERCDFLAGDELIKIIPRYNMVNLRLVCGDFENMEAGIPTIVPIWFAVLLKKRHQCQIVPPAWLSVEELKRLVVVESEMNGLAKLPNRLFEIAHILVREAKEDIESGDQLKSLIQDLWDRREAKLRSSSLKFISQNVTSHARMDNAQPMEIAGAGARATLSACKLIAGLISKSHDFVE